MGLKNGGHQRGRCDRLVVAGVRDVEMVEVRPSSSARCSFSRNMGFRAEKSLQL